MPRLRVYWTTAVSTTCPTFPNLPDQGGIFMTPLTCQIYPLITNAFLKKIGNLLKYTPP